MSSKKFDELFRDKIAELRDAESKLSDEEKQRQAELVTKRLNRTKAAGEANAEKAGNTLH